MKLVIVKLSSLGDIVHAMVALQFIKSIRPEIRIDWLVEERFAGLLAGNPDIERVMTVNLKSLKTHKAGIFREIAKIKAYAAAGYDLAIDAQGLLKSAFSAHLLAERCAGFDKHSIREPVAAWLYRDTVACPYEANTVERNVTVLTKPLGVEVTREQLLHKRPFLFYHAPREPLAHYFQSGKPQVVLVIGSTWPSRNYPKENYLKIVQGLAADCLIVSGSDQERRDAEWITSKSAARMLPRLSLNGLKAAIAKADLVIGNDTGPTHMAWGLNKPSITLFGPTPVSRVCLTDINKALKSPSKVDPRKLNKNDFSIAEIDVQKVIDLAESLLGN